MSTAEKKSQARLIGSIVAAQEEERRRISRELHDEIGQSLAAMLVNLTSLLEETAEPHLRRRIGDLIFEASKTIEDTRRLARGLRPALFDEADLKTAIQVLAADFARHHEIEVDLQIGSLEGAPEVPPVVAVTAYRILQEALTNVARHSEATMVAVVVERRPAGRLSLVVEDNGHGIPPTFFRTMDSSPGLGLAGIRERVDLVSGTFDIESVRGRTTLYATLPLELP